METFFRILKAEWLKLRRSTVVWLVTLGALFIPCVLLTARLAHPQAMPAAYRAGGFWEQLWNQTWEAVTLILLPMMVLLVVSLIVQIEFRNNTWKQVHSSPVPLPLIFLAKLVVILSVVVGFFLLLNAGAYLAAVLPAVLLPGVPYPAEPLPWALFAARNLHYFLGCLPIVALQYGLSLHCKNFMIPLGVGGGLWLAAIGGTSWRFIYLIPYNYAGMELLFATGTRARPALPASLDQLALLYFAVFLAAGLALYTLKSERG